MMVLEHKDGMLLQMEEKVITNLFKEPLSSMFNKNPMELKSLRKDTLSRTIIFNHQTTQYETDKIYFFVNLSFFFIDFMYYWTAIKKKESKYHQNLLNIFNLNFNFLKVVSIIPEWIGYKNFQWIILKIYDKIITNRNLKMDIESKNTRLQMKAQRRQAKRTQHLQVFQQNKENVYFDQALNEWQKIKYYQNINFQAINYQDLSNLLSSTFNHAKRRQNFFTIVDRQPDHTLKCVYSGDILSDQNGIFLQKCDQEHSFPQSYQRGSKAGTGRDMHAIFSAGKHANGSRGNTPFGNFGIVVQQDKYGKSYRDGKLKTYQPRLNAGAVARASLYILVCYKNCANQSYLPKRCLQWLVKTASETQVTQWQKHRNQTLYNLQGNRNPFIDFPQWAKLIDFNEGWQK